MNRSDPIELEYRVVENRDVRISVNSGNASKLAAIEILLEGPRVISEDVENTVDLLVGTGIEIRGLRLRIISTVSKILEQEDTTSITYKLIGGESDLVVSSEKQTDDFGFEVYLAEFTFI